MLGRENTMKKFALTVAAVVFGATAAYAATSAMDCCKDCCKDKAEHQHEAPTPKK
jgi:hypothetical protein